METVSNITAAASRAIWGDSTKKDATKEGQEPISGELGNVKAGEPYDKGNQETTSEPKSLAKTSSKELTSADSTANLPSTAAHTTPLPPSETKLDTETAITVPKDEKTGAATKAALESLENQAKDLSVDGSKAKGDGLVSAKKVEAGEGVNTGVKATEGLQTAPDPTVVAPVDKSLPPTPVASSSATTSAPVVPRKSESSSSSDDNTAEGGEKKKKKKVSLKDKIKAKLHKH